MKKCTKCRKYKDICNFRIRKRYYVITRLNRAKPGNLYFSWCGDCEKANKKKVRQNPVYKEAERQKNILASRTPEEQNKRKERKLQSRYGLTLTQWNQMKVDQNGKCANEYCDNVATDVDHCHETSKVRALLCGNCNKALGSARDSFDRLIGLAKYIQNHKGVI